MSHWRAARAIAVIGLGFGDEGKGATVDALVADLAGRGAEPTVVRFNGGAQAAHNVVLPDGRRHTFSQFGAGTLAGAGTHLTGDVLVEPIMLADELDRLAGLGVDDPLRGLTVSPQALVTTAVHVAANRAREDARGAGRHGSCGKGVGETRWYDLAARAGLRAGQMLGNLSAPADVQAPGLRVVDCRERRTLVRRLDALVRCYAPLIGRSDHDHPGVGELADLLTEFAAAVRQVEDCVAVPAALAGGPVVFEGAQGMLLDEDHGFHPHTTWSSCGPATVRKLVTGTGFGVHVMGVTRTYQTRHGAGPFPSEDPGLTVPERHNGFGRYQGGWRVGQLDLVLLRHAVRACGGVDSLSVTHVDVEDPALGLVAGYRVDGREWTVPPRWAPCDPAATAWLNRAVPVLQPATAADRIDAVAAAAGAPVGLLAHGPARDQRIVPAPDAARQVLLPAAS